MALDYVETSKKIIEAVGGAGNISSAGNCMTRLRLVLKDDKKANDEKVQSIKGVKGVMRQGGQYQIIIGNEVSNLFKGFKKLGNWGEDGGGAPQKATGNPVQRLFGFISGCMTPLLPAMLGTGMLKVVLILLTTFAGMQTSGSTYILLYSFADCFFTFLPIFMGITIAKKTGGNPMLFMVVGAALCYPNLTSLMGFVIMTGMHYALIPMMFNNLATLGFDVLVLVTQYCSNIAQGGAALGAAFKTKNEEVRSEGIACGISATIAGVTEPAMYGINLRFIRPMIAATIAAGISGLICGIFEVHGYVAAGTASLLTTITFIGENDPTHSLIFGAISGITALVVSFVLSYILYKDPEPAAAAPETSGTAAASALSDTVITSPIVGEAVALTSIQDAVFSTETLGKGIAIEPSVGEVHAPCDGTISTFFDTGHAFGLAADSGAEFLIHVGMDTIKLGGKGFTPMVKEGDRVKKGQLLLKFDINYIKSQGLPVTTPVVVSNTDDFSDVISLTTGKVDLKTNLLEIKK